MDTDRFDALVRSFPTNMMRRTVLAGVLGAYLGVLARWFGDSEAGARNKKKKKKCKVGTKKCGKKCIPATECCPACGAGQRCCNGACIATAECCGCGAGEKCCNGLCIPTSQCCGGCGALTCCAGTCVDLATNGANCGSCGRACSAGCLHGACACPGGHTQCSSPFCLCTASVEGGFGCNSGEAVLTSCEENADCSVGSFCASAFPEPHCRIPCG